MNDLIEKLKDLLRKAMPFLLGGLILYGSYNIYKRGSIVGGVKATVSGVLRNVPFFGSRFRSYGRGRSYYASRPRYRGHRRHHRGHRRHRR